MGAIQSRTYESGVIFQCPVQVLWNSMWKQINSYFIIVSKRFITIVYGHNPTTTKYFGACWSVGKNIINAKFLEKLVKVYGLKGKAGYTVQFQD